MLKVFLKNDNLFCKSVNFFQNNKDLEEKWKLKINKYCPGTNLKILRDYELTKQKIDYAIIFPWNFKNEIMKNLNEFEKDGGKFIIPFPKIQIINEKKGAL